MAAIINESPHFPDEALPDGAVVDGERLSRDVDEQFDFVVIGSGAAGAVAACTLAKAGFSVAIVEEGPWVKTRDFGEGVYDAFKRMFRDGGMQMLEGRSFMPLIQGRCVGGSTVMNSAIAWRTPDDVLDDWATRFGLGDALTRAALEPHFEALERALNVHPVEDEAMGRSNHMFLEQGAKAGIAPGRMRRYERGCKGSGRCMTGCPHGAKQGMSVTLVPEALAHGARIFTSCHVDKVLFEGRRACGVIATANADSLAAEETRGAHATPRRGGARVRLRARRGVFVAASTIQTPNILRRSGVRGAALGAHFQAHPGYGMGALFDHPVEMNVGATQGAESVHFRVSDRIKIETIAMQPELAAVRIPGIGAELMRRFESFSHVAVWALVVRSEAEGAITSGWRGRDVVTFSLTRADMQHVRKGAAIVARLMFEAGAREVWPGIFGVPAALKSPDEVKLIENGPDDARAYSFIATHLFGAARMGPESASSVVGKDFVVHGTQSLYVVDSSVFPTNLGVNPQHTIMAISRLAAEQTAARFA